MSVRELGVEGQGKMAMAIVHSIIMRREARRHSSDEQGSGDDLSTRQILLEETSSDMSSVDET